MFRLAAVLYSLIATAMAGAAVIFVLSAGYVAAQAIVVAAGAGAVLAAPASWIVARKLYESTA